MSIIGSEQALEQERSEPRGVVALATKRPTPPPIYPQVNIYRVVVPSHTYIYPYTQKYIKESISVKLYLNM
jgi:hypothetical protein